MNYLKKIAAAVTLLGVATFGLAAPAYAIGSGYGQVKNTSKDVINGTDYLSNGKIATYRLQPGQTSPNYADIDVASNPQNKTVCWAKTFATDPCAKRLELGEPNFIYQLYTK